MTEEHENLGFDLPAPAKASRTGVVVVLLLLVGGAFAFGYARRSTKESNVPLPVNDKADLHVEVLKPTAISSDRALSLPGTVKALEQTKIYPRVTGYVRRWLVDIGDEVKEGQLLAEIDTPDLDAQISQARAQLASAQASVNQAIAQRNYTKSNAARYATLSDQQLVAKSQVEQTQAQASTDEATVAAAQSNVTAQEANLRRMLDNQSFAKVVAPFAGTITTRTVERGELVTDTKTAEMFTLVATDPVRIFVEVPQTVAPSVRAGTDATISVREYAGRTFSGKVTRSAGALDPDLHTMTTEVQVPNPDGMLLPGMYVEVALLLPVPHRVLEIPSTALYTDAQGVRVATVDAQQKIHYMPIQIERDTGNTIQVASGLTGDERIVKIAMPTLVEGDPVEVTEAKTDTKLGSAAPANK